MSCSTPLQIVSGHGPEEDVVPVLLISNVEKAKEMRFGNTLQELTLASWMPYTDTHLFYSRGEATGDGKSNKLSLSIKMVYAEYRTTDLNVIRTQAVYPVRDGSGAVNGIVFPRFKLGDIRSTGYLIKSDFNE